MKVSEVTAFLENAYNVLNEEYFNGELLPVVITIQSSKANGHYTCWDAWSEKGNGYREINLGQKGYQEVFLRFWEHLSTRWCIIIVL